jgi:hypothetical protein
MKDATSRCSPGVASSTSGSDQYRNANAGNLSDPATFGQLAPSLLSIALNYAARGFAVFPCLEKTKEPATGRRGFHNATTNPATIRRWFGSAFHQYNIAIATGMMSGVFVVDIDGSNGAFAIAELEAQHGPLPATLTSISASGCHLWFQIDEPIPSSNHRIGICIDGRGCGGYILAPPSIHPDGPIYRWANDRPIAMLPEWLARLARRAPPPLSKMISPINWKPAREAGGNAYGRAALDRECIAVATARPTTRNHTLNRASFSLHQLVAGGELDEAEVRDRLMCAAIACGLDEDDGGMPAVMKTIASGARAGLACPRRRPA